MRIFGRPIWRGSENAVHPPRSPHAHPMHGPHAGPPQRPHRFFFVSGHPRSGTNWVSSLINLHPEAFCDGEFHFLILRWAMDGYTSLPWYLGGQEPYRGIAERNFHRLIRESLVQRARDRRGGHAPAVLGDHTPRLFRIMITPPEARYIIVQRDGRDVLVSYTFHLLNAGAPDVIPDNIRPFFVRQLESLDGSQDARRAAGRALLGHEPWVRYYANFWSEHVLHDRRIAGTVAAQGFGPYLKFVRYEDVRADVEAGRRGLYGHLGLDPAKAAPISAETNTAPGFGGREDVSSFYRKGESGDWRNYFTPDAARWFHQTAGTAMSDLGYEADGAWVESVQTPKIQPANGTQIAPRPSGGAASTPLPPRVQVQLNTAPTTHQTHR